MYVRCWLGLLAATLQAAPLLVVLSQDASPWQAEAEKRGWKILLHPVGLVPVDSEIKALQGAVEKAIEQPDIDRARVYIAGHGPAVAHVFYAASRIPHLWAAGIAVDGAPKAAIDTNRLFAANARLVPVIWTSAEQEPMPVARLTVADFRFERAPSLEEAVEKASRYSRDQYIYKIDCETGSTAFPACYWLDITRFDPSKRNDVLQSTRVIPGSGAFLALGGFGFNVNLPGPGVVVGLLPENYKGPLRIEDRIVSVGGTAIADARDYIRLMDDMTQAKPIGVIIQRGKERIRLETRVLLPVREETVTARVQAERTADGDIFVISRGVAAFRVTLPESWIPATVNWNGNAAGRADAAGCWQITEGQPAQRCP